MASKRKNKGKGKGRSRASSGGGGAVVTVVEIEGVPRGASAGALVGFLCDEAGIHIETDPPGAIVALSRYEESGLLLLETDPEHLGETPLNRSLPLGSPARM